MATRHVVEPAVAPNVRHRYSCCRHSAADGAEPKERTRRRRRRTTFGRGSDLLLSLLFQDDDGARFPRSAGEEVRGALRSRRADGTEALLRCERSKKAPSFFLSPLFLSFLFFLSELHSSERARVCEWRQLSRRKTPVFRGKTKHGGDGTDNLRVRVARATVFSGYAGTTAARRLPLPFSAGLPRRRKNKRRVAPFDPFGSSGAPSWRETLGRNTRG